MTYQHPPHALRKCGLPFTCAVPSEFDSGIMDSVNKLVEAIQGVSKDRKGKVGFYDKKVVFQIAKNFKTNLGKVVKGIGTLNVTPDFSRGKKGWTLKGTLDPNFDEEKESLAFFDIVTEYKGKGLTDYSVKVTPTFYKLKWNDDHDAVVAEKDVVGKHTNFADSTELEAGFDDWANTFAATVKKRAGKINAEFEKSRMVGDKDEEEDEDRGSLIQSAVLNVRTLTFDRGEDRLKLDAGLHVVYGEEGSEDTEDFNIQLKTKNLALDPGYSPVPWPAKRIKQDNGTIGISYDRTALEEWLSKMVGGKEFFDEFVQDPLDYAADDTLSVDDLPEVEVNLKTKSILEADFEGGGKEEQTDGKTEPKG